MARRTLAALLALALTAGLAQGAGATTPHTTATTTPSATGAVTAGHARLTTPVLSARRLPNLLAAQAADSQVKAALAPLVAQATPTSCLVVTDERRPVDEVNPNLPLMPASTEKLLTSTALLAHTGPDTTMQTRAVTAAGVSNGVIGGDLYVIGAGDPLLATTGDQPSQEDPNEPYNDFAKLAAAIKAAGITAVNGNVVGDDSFFDTQRYVGSWPGRYITAGEVGPLSALMVNGGFTGLTDNPQAPSPNRQAGDPPSLAAATLITLLRQQGITVSGSAASAKAPAGTHQVAALASLPLSQDLLEMLRRSDNTTAEVLTKYLGATVAHQGSTAAGAKVVHDTLTHLGLPTQGTVTVDGSGLDLGNRVTCDLLTAALDHAGPDSVLAKSLPVAGQTGTLRFRLNHTPAAGKVAAKTGTLDGVNALAGYVHAAGGQVLSFSFIINGSSPNAPALLDQAAVALSQYGATTSLAALSPQAPGS
jgi:serine-type D-Ala-D-Ala carboxypeptidase/endopeptidase (penicillin-binding protein 4)